MQHLSKPSEVNSLKHNQGLGTYLGGRELASKHKALQVWWLFYSFILESDNGNESQPLSMLGKSTDCGQACFFMFPRLHFLRKVIKLPTSWDHLEIK